MAGIWIDETEYNHEHGKFRRMCEPKRTSGDIEVPSDIHEQYMSKGQSRTRLFEAFIKTGGVKDGGEGVQGENMFFFWT